MSETTTRTDNTDTSTDVGVGVAEQALPSGAGLLVPTGGELPVGTILAFAGRWPEGLADQGWYPCDGRSVSTSGAFAELFVAIGYAFGRPAVDQFSLPDLRGWFLRGTSSDAAARSEREPDWFERQSAISIFDGMAPGDGPHLVGSTQDYGTAPARTSFTATHDHLNISNAHDDAGCADRPGNYTDDAQTFPATGGDRESRPVNKYVYYVVKVRSTSTSSADVPVGALVPFAGQTSSGPPPPTWQICHGDVLSQYDTPALFTALSYVHGGSGENFVLPDYRGWFQRGVSSSSPVDPDALSRTCAYPKGAFGAQGNSGNAVGSAQTAATGAPLGNPFMTSVAKLPTTDASKRVAGDLWNLLAVSGSSLLVSLSDSGGDAETRPVNVSVDWYVRSLPDAEPAAVYPVGAVALMGCTLDVNEWWLPCDGRLLSTAGNEALRAAIGTTYGGNDTAFNLPDYRSRFLRGASYDSGTDPDVEPPSPGKPFIDHRQGNASIPVGGVGTFQDWATGRPVTPFQGSIPHYPQTDLGAHGATNGGNACDDGAATFNTCTTGGDSETRPRNVYLNHYIRVK